MRSKSFVNIRQDMHGPPLSWSKIINSPLNSTSCYDLLNILKHRIKNKGDKGQPCHNPIAESNQEVGDLLTSTE